MALIYRRLLALTICHSNLSLNVLKLLLCWYLCICKIAYYLNCSSGIKVCVCYSSTQESTKNWNSWWGHFRSISKLCVVAKVLEKNIYGQVYVAPNISLIHHNKVFWEVTQQFQTWYGCMIVTGRGEWCLGRCRLQRLQQSVAQNRSKCSQNLVI